MSEDVLTEQTQEIFDSIKNDAEALENSVKEAQKTTRKLTKFFSDPNTFPEFDKPQAFRTALIEQSEHIGNALYVVLAIETKRLGLTKPTEETHKPNPTQPVVNIQSTPAVVQAPGGLGGYLGVRAQAGAQKEIERMRIEAQQQQPKITTEQRVTDILAFGRDLIPEAINKTLAWFRHALAQVQLFPDETTKRVLHEDLGTHCNKLSAIIQSFYRTATEYRKSVLDELKMQLLKSVSDVVTARYIGEGKMPLSELFKQMREAGGSTKF